MSENRIPSPLATNEATVVSLELRISPSKPARITSATNTQRIVIVGCGLRIAVLCGTSRIERKHRASAIAPAMPMESLDAMMSNRVVSRSLAGLWDMGYGPDRGAGGLCVLFMEPIKALEAGPVKDKRRSAGAHLDLCAGARPEGRAPGAHLDIAPRTPVRGNAAFTPLRAVWPAVEGVHRKLPDGEAASRPRSLAPFAQDRWFPLRPSGLITPVSARDQKWRRCRSSVHPSLPEWAGGFDQGRRGSRPYLARGDANSGRDAFHRVRRAGLSNGVPEKHLACLTVSDRREVLNQSGRGCRTSVHPH